MSLQRLQVTCNYNSPLTKRTLTMLFPGPHNAALRRHSSSVVFKKKYFVIEIIEIDSVASLCYEIASTSFSCMFFI